MTALWVVGSIAGYLLVGTVVSAVVSAVFELGDHRSPMDWIDQWGPAVAAVFFWPLALIVGTGALAWLALRPLWFKLTRRLNPAYAARAKKA